MKNYGLHHVEPIKDLKEMLHISKDKYGERDAFRIKDNDGYKTISYDQLLHDANALGEGLLSIGLEGKHIAIIGENSYEWVVSFLGVVNGVGVVVPIDKELSRNSLLNVIQHSDARVVIYSNSLADKIEDISNELNEDFIYISMNDASNELNQYTLYEILNIGDQLLRKGSKNYIEKKIDPTALSLLLYTSGTTGNSKGVMLSHRNIVTTIVAALKTVNVETVCLSVLPIHHSFEATCGILTSIYDGVTICLNDDLKYFLENLKLFKPSHIYLVPLFVETMMKKIWQEAEKSGKAKMLRKLIKVSNGLLKFGIDLRPIFFKKIHRAFGGKLKLIVCGGAKLKPELIEAYLNFGITLLNGYGITECSPLISVNRRKYYNDKSVGVVVPSCKVKIDEPDSNGEGEILVYGTNVMLGYYKNPKATMDAFIDGWFKTGDIGKIDADGFLYICGRKKDIIILDNGENIYPEELENLIVDSPFIKEVIVYSEMNALSNKEQLVADIYPDYDYINQCEDKEYIDKINKHIFCVNNELPSYKRIYNIRYRKTEFEKTTTKKIKRHKINQEKKRIQPGNEIEKIIYELIQEILSIDHLCVNDNVFSIGMDSLDALRLVSELEGKGYSLSVKDVYNNPTIRTLSKTIDNNHLVTVNKEDNFIVNLNEYEDISDIKERVHESFELNTILLTGATGFLGVHILSELLDKTNSKIYCLIRNKTKLIEMLDYYHGTKYQSEIGKRIIPIKGDITKVFFGVNKEDYQKIINEINTLIHCAADVRHFGKWDDLKQVNVVGTINAIQIAKHANCKLEYISTLSVSGEELVKQTKGVIEFDEDTLYVGQEYTENVYVHSKFLAECKVIDAIREGLNANIYRVGNVTWRYSDGLFQKNRKENWFYTLTEAFTKIGAITKNLGNVSVDLTPVDKSAEAIVKLMQQNSCNVYHIYNPHEITMKSYLSHFSYLEDVSLIAFKKIITELDYDNTLGILLTYATVVSDNLNENELIPNVLRTCQKLNSLGFDWPVINNEYIEMIKSVIGT